MEPLKIGDEVTIVVGVPWVLLYGHVSIAPQEGRHGVLYFDVKPLDGSFARLRRFDTEGVWWCRGHSGEAVLALEVATALRYKLFLDADSLAVVSLLLCL